MSKILISGLSGEFDIINALVLFSSLRSQGLDVRLGSSKNRSISNLTKDTPFADSSSLVSARTLFHNLGPHSHYAEARIAEFFDEEVFYFTRRKDDIVNEDALREAFFIAKVRFGFSHQLFIDTGGDSLVLKVSDVTKDAQETHPMEEDDTLILSALSTVAIILA
jgi:hypothetical protein